MRFASPEWIYFALAAPPALGGLAWWYIGNNLKLMEGFVSPQLAARLLPEGLETRKKVKAAALVSVVVLLALAMARPQYGIKPREVKRAGIDIMILLDTSNSMAATDIKPSRMERAKYELTRLVSALEGNRIGIMAFAGESFVECPLTMDSGTVRMFLDTLDTGIIPTPGTAIGKAVEDAVANLKNSGPAKTKAVILVTDGEDLEGEAKQAAKAAKSAGVKIYGAGIGSAAGAPVPEVDDLGNVTGYKKDDNGAPLLTRLDTTVLSALSSATGGVFVASQGESMDISKLIESLKKQEKADIGSFEFTEYEERYTPLVALAILLLVGEYALAARWRKEA